MLCVCFGLAQSGELLLSLLLEVLEQVEDTGAMSLVHSRCRSVHVIIVSIGILAGLHQGHQLCLVVAGEACRVYHGRHGLDYVLNSGARLQLREGSWVLGHFLGEDANGARKRVNGLNKISLIGEELTMLLLTDEG